MMAKEYDGWIAKDKHGDFWYGTFGKEKEDVESHIKDAKWRRIYKFKIVKVKFVEVE